jgi:hypothetical protein
VIVPKITWRALSLNTNCSMLRNPDEFKICSGSRQPGSNIFLENSSSGVCSYCSKNLQALLLNPCSVSDTCSLVLWRKWLGNQSAFPGGRIQIC